MTTYMINITFVLYLTLIIPGFIYNSALAEESSIEADTDLNTEADHQNSTKTSRIDYTKLISQNKSVLSIGTPPFDDPADLIEYFRNRYFNVRQMHVERDTNRLCEAEWEELDTCIDKYFTAKRQEIDAAWSEVSEPSDYDMGGFLEEMSARRECRNLAFAQHLVTNCEIVGYNDIYCGEERYQFWFNEDYERNLRLKIELEDLNGTEKLCSLCKECDCFRLPPGFEQGYLFGSLGFRYNDGVTEEECEGKYEDKD